MSDTVSRVYGFQFRGVLAAVALALFVRLILGPFKRVTASYQTHGREEPSPPEGVGCGYLQEGTRGVVSYAKSVFFDVGSVAYIVPLLQRIPRRN